MFFILGGESGGDVEAGDHRIVIEILMYGSCYLSALV